jgi:hypothetical protein
VEIEVTGSSDEVRFVWQAILPTCDLRPPGELKASQDWLPHNKFAAQFNFPDRQTRRGRNQEI